MPPESHSVPWKGVDVLIFFAVWFAAQVFCGIVVGVADIAYSNPQAHTAAAKDADSGHLIAQLVEQSNTSLLGIFVAFLAAVVIAPIVEEFLFRLLFQGWLESKLTWLQVPCSNSVAIVTVSFCFAMIHGGNSGTWDLQVLMLMFGIVTVTNVLLLVLGIIYLRRKRHVRLIPYLLGKGRFFPPQFFTYTGWCLATLVLLLGLTAALNAVYPNTNISPIPIFFFSLLLGTLFSKTQNLSYCILLHACLNATSFSLLWLATNIME